MENYKGNVSASGIVLGSLIAQGGPQGKTGKEGYTPVKGVDYYTEAEKQEIIQGITADVEEKIEPLEHERQSKEQERIENENTRLSKEIERQTAELSRISNEDIRQQKEAIRETQESEREDSENRRIETFSQMKKNVESAINNIEDMTDAYNRNASEKTNDFNNNVTSKTEIFDANATSKTDAFNQNAADKTTTFNDNAQEKIDEFNINAAALENRVSNLETDNANNKQDILNIKAEQNTQNTKLTDLENKNVEQDAEITNIKAEQETQNNKLNNIENINTTQGNSIQELQKNIANLQSYNETNDTNILNIQSEQEEQNNSLTMLKASDYSQDKLIDSLQTQIIDLETENENIKNQFPTGQAEGENITLNDSADMEFKELRIGGNSWQETRSGKNKLDTITKKEWTSNGVTFTPVLDDNGDVLYVNCNGTATKVTTTALASFEPELNVNYIVSGCPIGGTDKTAYVYVTGGIVNQNGEETNAIWTTEGRKTYQVIIQEGVTITNMKFYPMIRLATETDSTYEPYGAMPSPEFRSEIRNVGDNVNEFDATKISTDTGIIVEDKGKTIKMPIATEGNGGVSTGKKLSELCPNLKVGDTVYVHFKRNLKRTINNIIYIIGTGEWGNGSSKTITQEMLDGTVMFYGNRFIDGETEQCILTNFKIEKSSKATSHSPYNCGSANITVCNKNLAVINDGSINTYRLLFPIQVSAGDIITCITDFTNTNDEGLEVRVYDDENFTNIVQTLEYIPAGGSTIKRYTITQDGYFTMACGHGYNAVGISKMFVAKGEYSLEDYEERKVQQICFPLAEGQRMYKDSYLADDGVHHKRGQYEFTGDENWTKSNGYTTETSFACFTDLISPAPVIVSPSEANHRYGFCTIGQVDCFVYMSEYKNGFFHNNNSFHFLKIEKTSIPNWNESLTDAEKVNLFKAYLAEQYANGTPLIVEYDLEKPIIEPYTEEQQLVYNEIKKAHSYKNVTHIFSTDEIKPVLDVTYRKDLETMFNNINTAIVSLGGV